MLSIKNNKIRWAISAVLALLILFGTYRGVFSLAAFLITGLMLVFCDEESNLLQIFFVLPMANIFKFNSEVQSFFTIIILIYVILHLVLPRKATFIVALFAIYILVTQLRSGGFDLFRTIKFICNLLFLSSTLNGNVKARHGEIFLSYIVGNIVASFFATTSNSFFKIEQYIGAKELGGLEFEDGITRFAGLYSDPNYYSISIIISLCLLVVLYDREEISGFVTSILTVPLIYFSVITYSKSALIMLLLPFALFLYSVFRRKKYTAICITLIASVIILCLVISEQIPALNIVLTRIEAGETSEGIDINTLTTGRYNLWLKYIRAITKDIGIILFGTGINTRNLDGNATHNTYLDALYFLGLSGTVLLGLSLKAISSQYGNTKFKRSPINYSIVICIVIMYFFLSELFYFDPPFHIFLAVTVLHLSPKKQVPETFTDISVKRNEQAVAESNKKY